MADIGLRMLTPRELYRANGFKHFSDIPFLNCGIVMETAQNVGHRSRFGYYNIEVNLPAALRFSAV